MVVETLCTKNRVEPRFVLVDTKDGEHHFKSFIKVFKLNVPLTTFYGSEYIN